MNSDSLTFILGCTSTEDTDPDPKPVHSVLDLLSEYEDSSLGNSCKRGSLGRSFGKYIGTHRKPMSIFGGKESINRSISMVS